MSDAGRAPGRAAAELTPAARKALEAVLELLRDERSSVSSVTEPERAWQVHVEDSLTGLVVPELVRAHRIADVGSGAGFPGLPVAAALPEAHVDLIEASARKCDFIRRAAAKAGIENARVLNERAENRAEAPPPRGGRESYDAVTARAVGWLSTLAELASPLLEQGGTLVAWKGRRSPEEEVELEGAAERLAMEPVRILDVGGRPGSRHRHLHVVRKSGPTPEGLPRRPGMAQRRPFG